MNSLHNLKSLQVVTGDVEENIIKKVANDRADLEPMSVVLDDRLYMVSNLEGIDPVRKEVDGEAYYQYELTEDQSYALHELVGWYHMNYVANCEKHSILQHMEPNGDLLVDEAKWYWVDEYYDYELIDGVDMRLTYLHD